MLSLVLALIVAAPPLSTLPPLVKPLAPKPAACACEVCRCGKSEAPKIVPPPPKKGPCSAACICGCVSSGVCTCARTPKVTAATPKVLPTTQAIDSIPGLGGCYIDAQGRKVCPLKLK